jgi:hypothetical protein
MYDLLDHIEEEFGGETLDPCISTNPQRALEVPTSSAYSILLSPIDLGSHFPQTDNSRYGISGTKS